MSESEGVPVQALNLDRLAVLDGASKGDYSCLELNKSNAQGRRAPTVRMPSVLGTVSSNRLFVLCFSATYMKIRLLRSRPVEIDLAHSPDPRLAHVVSQSISILSY